MKRLDSTDWFGRLRYEFDLNGFVWIRNYFDQGLIEHCRKKVAELETASKLPLPLVESKPRTKQELYISNIAELDERFTSIIKDETIISIIERTTQGLFRFNHSYSISHWKGGATHMHMGGAPIHPKATYQVVDGEIFSCLTKAVIPLDNHDIEDGCFCVVPGSHKSNFPNPYNGQHPKNHPCMVPINAQPGDLVVFSEALQHGGLENVSGRTRRSMFYCYSVGYMPDWTKLSLVCSEDLMNHPDDQIRQIVKLKVD